MLRPRYGNSSGLPIVLPGMPSISARGIVTGTAGRGGGGGRERASRDTARCLRLNDSSFMPPGINGTGYYFRRETRRSRTINLVT